MPEIQKTVESDPNKQLWYIIEQLYNRIDNPEYRIVLINRIKEQIGSDMQFKSHLEELLKKDPKNQKLKELYDLFYSQKNSEKKESVENNQEISKLEEFFWIENWILGKIENNEQMKELWFSTLEALKKYQDYIEDELNLNSNSELSNSDYLNMISNIKWIILKKLFISLWNLDRYKNDRWKLENMQWIANSNLKEDLSDVPALLITWKFYLLMKQKDSRWYFWNINQKSNEIKNERMKIGFNSWVKWVILDFETNIVKWSNIKEIPKWILWNKTLIQQSSETYYTNEDYLIDQKFDWTKTLMEQKKELEVSFLNEEDKEIEEKSMYYYLSWILIQMTPWVWLLPSLVVSAEDTFSSYDATLEWLKRMDLVPNKYKFDKSFIYNILWWAWTISSLVWLNELSKWTRLFSIMKNIPNFSFNKMQIALNTLCNKLNMSPNMIAKLILYIKNWENLTDLWEFSKVDINSNVSN